MHRHSKITVKTEPIYSENRKPFFSESNRKPNMKQNESGEELNKRHKAVNGQKEICSKPFLLYAFILLFWKREFLKKNNQESYVLVVYEKLFSLGFVSQLRTSYTYALGYG